MPLIHFANYFRFMEEAETEFLYQLGDLAGVTPGDDFFVAPRVAVSAEFLKPVRFGDLLDITIRCEHKGRTSIGYAFSFELEGAEVARASLRVVCVAKGIDGEYRSAPIPEALDRVLQAAPTSEPRA
jgi:acyl-CoA thioester hydrolase